MNRRKFFKISSAAAIAGALPVSALAATSGNTTAASRPCRVTVLRRECFADLQSRFLDEPEAGPCPVFHSGQKIVDEPVNLDRLVAQGKFCPKAWQCIKDRVIHLPDQCCNSRPHTEASSTLIACCNDGTRPVLFKVEML